MTADNDPIRATHELLGLDQSEYAAKIGQLKLLVGNDDSVKWQIGDLLLDLAGSPGTGQVGLRRLAIEIGRTEQYATMMRAVAFRYPPVDRRFPVPWEFYHLVMAEGELTLPILETFTELVAEAKPDRPPSRALLQQAISRVNEERGIPPRQVHHTQTELLTRQLTRWLKRWRNGMIQGEPPTVLQQLMYAADEVAETAERALPASLRNKLTQQHG